MTLEEAISAIAAEESHEAALASIKSLTVSSPKTVWGANVQTVLSKCGIVGFLQDTAGASGQYSQLRDLCILLLNRFMAGGEIDFSDPAVSYGITAITQHPTVEGLIQASEFGDVSTFVAVVEAIGQQQVPMFPEVTLRDVIAIREPALVAGVQSTPVHIDGISQKLSLTTSQALPEVVRATVEISDDGVVWQRVSVNGLDQVKDAGRYGFRVNPGPLFSATSVLRVTLPYTTGVVVE